MLARAFASALLVLVTIVAAEEMPAGSRAYAVSLLAMAGGLGAGVCVMALNLADLGTRGWRILYVLPLLALPAIASTRHHLRESRRFLAPHRRVPIKGHGGRLALLAVSALLVNLFIAPNSQFSNRFLRSELGFSGGLIGLFSVVVGTPAAIGIVAGGRIADVRGRRIVAAVALVGGTACTVAFFFSGRRLAAVGRGPSSATCCRPPPSPPWASTGRSCSPPACGARPTGWCRSPPSAAAPSGSPRRA